MSIIEVSDLRSYLRIPDDDTDDDVLMGLAIEAATSAINRSANRTFDAATSPTSRVFTAKFDADVARVVIDINDTFEDADDVDIVYPAGLVDGAFDTPVTGDFRMWPYNAAEKGRPFTRIVISRNTTCPVGEVEVTTAWGWDLTPDTIKNAALLQASRYLKRRDAPFGIAGSPEMGNEMRLLARLDPDVSVMVADYKRWWA